MKIIKNFILLFILLLTSACPSWGPMCVEADDFDDKKQQRITLHANNDDWINSRVRVVKGAPLQIKTSGYINLCYNPAISDETSNMTLTDTGEVVVQVKTNGKASAWTSTGQIVNQGEDFSMKLDGRVSFWNSGNTWDYKGTYLEIYIGNSPPSPFSFPGYNELQDVYNQGGYAFSGNGDNHFMARALLEYIEANGSYVIDVDDPDLYEQQTGQTLRKVIPAPVSGNIYYRYLDSDHGDNREGYLLTFYRQCAGSNGKFVLARVARSLAEGESGIPDKLNEKFIKIHDYAGGETKGVYNENAPATGNLYFKIVDDVNMDWGGDGQKDGYFDNNYTNNYGQYNIDITTIEPKKDTASLLSKIVEPVKDMLHGTEDEPGVAEVFFTNLTSNNSFINLIRLLMTIAIILYGLAYIMGLSGNSLGEFLMLVFKLAIMVQLISPGSWDFFYNYVFKAFVEGLDDLIFIMTNQLYVVMEGVVDIGEKGPVAIEGDTFAFIGQTLDKFVFSQKTWMKLQALLLDFPIIFFPALGVSSIFAILIIMGLGIYLTAALRAVYVYVVCLIFLAILLGLAPIFISFYLFNSTKALFDKWLKYLMRYTIEPVMLLSFLSIFNIFVYSALYNVLTFSVCWDCWKPLVIPLGFMDLEICWMSAYVPWGSEASSSFIPIDEGAFSMPPVSFIDLLLFFMFSYLMLKFGVQIQILAGVFTAQGADIRPPVVGKVGGKRLSSVLAGKIAD